MIRSRYFRSRRVRPLADLPNDDGFEFLGVSESNAILPCKIVMTSDGTHRAFTQDGNPIYAKLIGWFSA